MTKWLAATQSETPAKITIASIALDGGCPLQNHRLDRMEKLEKWEGKDAHRGLAIKADRVLHARERGQNSGRSLIRNCGRSYLSF